MWASSAFSKRVMGIEPTLSAWKAEVLPLNYTRFRKTDYYYCFLVLNLEGEGFEPSKAEPSDLQSDPFDRSGTPPENKPVIVNQSLANVNCSMAWALRPMPTKI